MPVKKEVHTADMEIEQKPDIEMPMDGPVDREPDVIEAVDRLPNQDYLDELAFNEEPVTIRIERGSEKNAPFAHDVWCQGIGAEIFENGRWVSRTSLPVGRPVITKRKYVEIVARMKLDTISTNVVERNGEDPVNMVQRSTSSIAPFSVLKDDNPRGVEWLQKLVGQNF